MKKHWFSCLGLSLFLIPFSSTYAFDVIDEKISYADSKYVTLGVGLGFTGFTNQTGIEGGTGLGFRVSAGHHFNRFLEGEIAYQFSTFRYGSPDPINTKVNLRTRAEMNEEMFRLVASYPNLLLQPFVSAGIGGYNFIGVSQETALSFPHNWMIPLSAGIRAYTYKNLVSFQVEYSYEILFGENQPRDTLALLGLKKVEFNTYGFMTSAVFHFF